MYNMRLEITHNLYNMIFNLGIFQSIVNFIYTSKINTYIKYVMQMMCFLRRACPCKLKYDRWLAYDL